MPKKRTYEQLERALKRAENEAARNDRARASAVTRQHDLVGQFRRREAATEDKAADRVAEVEAKNDELEGKLKTEGARIVTLGQENYKISTLRQEEGTLADKQRADAAELNLIYCRKALEASNRVSLGLLDITAMAVTTELPRKADGVTIGNPLDRIDAMVAAKENDPGDQGFQGNEIRTRGGGGPA